MRKKNWLIVFLLLFTAVISKAQVGAVIWQEDFNTLNTTLWNVVTGDGTGTPAGAGWGNMELEYYNTSNVYIAAVPGESGNSALVLEAKAEAMGSRAFTSGKVTTSDKLSIKYGLIEMRVRIPNLQTGLWPAAWLLGTSTANWPAKGEIDMMEMGHNITERTRQGFPNAAINNYMGSNLIFYSADAVSTGNPSGAASTAWDVTYDSPYVSPTPLNDRFVLYRLYWSSTAMRFTVVDGGVETDLYTSPFALTAVSDEFNNPFYLLFNLAVGGTFTDATSNGQITAPLPGKMYVDYVKVSKWNNEGEVTIGGPAPKTGTFGIFTDNTATTDKLAIGTSADIWAWNNCVAGTTAAYEGSNVLAWATTDATQWFGGGIQARQTTDMSNFATSGNLKFRIKIPANVNFKVGMTDNYTNEKFISFPANTNQYGLTRDGNWGQVTIPISTFGGTLAFQSMNYLFAIVSDGALPSSTIQFAVDDIYWEGGGGVVNVPVTGVTLTSTASVAVGATSTLVATIAPANASNKNVTWTSSNTAIATVSTSGVVTGVAAGSATITVKTTDGSKTATCAVTVTAGNVAVTGVTLSPTSASVAAVATQQLTATIAPTNATNKTVSYTSSNTAVATVNANGLVTGVAAGSATITVTSADGAKTATCAITVTIATVAVTGVTVTPTTASLALGATQQLTATVAPTNASVKTVTWSSSNTAVATVNTSGLITAVAAGSATITVTTTSGAKTATCAVTVTNVTTNLALNKTTTVSSTEDATTIGSYAVDGNSTTTRWSSAFADPQWIYVDLGATYNVNEVKITWEAACGANYLVQISPDASTWSTMKTITGNAALVNDHTGLTGSGRYVRIYGTTRTTVYGYSIYELEVYGTSNTTVSVTSVSLSPTTATITAGGTQQLTATVAPTNATNKTVSYASNNTAVATVNASGLITAVAAGSATITVTTADGAKTATCAVTVNAATIAVTGVTMTPTAASITIGGTQQLTATVAPTNATTKTVTYASSNTAVATVNASGLVTAVAAGSATITVTTTSGAKTATCAVTVTGSTPCSVTASTGDFKVNVSSATSNPTLTFVPVLTGAGSSVCILYYSTSLTATFPGYMVTPNTPFQITAAAGATIYFYYTYSTPANGEKSTVNTKNSFTVGSCSTLKDAVIEDEMPSLKENSFAAYPVPMGEILTLKFTPDTYQQAIIYDMNGIQLLLENIASTDGELNINVSTLPKGVYYVSLQGASFKANKLVVK